MHKGFMPADMMRTFVNVILSGKVSGYPPKKAAKAAGLRPIPGWAFKT